MVGWVHEYMSKMWLGVCDVDSFVWCRECILELTVSLSDCQSVSQDVEDNATANMIA